MFTKFLKFKPSIKSSSLICIFEPSWNEVILASTQNLIIGNVIHLSQMKTADLAHTFFPNLYIWSVSVDLQHNNIATCMDTELYMQHKSHMGSSSI